MWSLNSFLRKHTFSLWFLLVLFFCVLKYSDCESCLNRSPCECILRNGSVIDLSSLGYHHTARFENLKATDPKDQFKYFYNPCYSFEIGDGDCSKGVSACKVANKSYYNLGDPSSGHFQIDGNVIKVLYSSSSSTLNVTLVCSEDAEIPEITDVAEKTTSHYAMTLKTKCACPDLCGSSHLSTGSVLVIIFMIFVALYLFLGIVHSSLTRGAHGWELIPHYEFWADFPLLVRDGCVFVVSGCKPETAYERI